MARWVPVVVDTVDAIDGKTGETIQRKVLRRVGEVFEAPDRQAAIAIGALRWPHASRIESVASLEARNAHDPVDG